MLNRTLPADWSIDWQPKRNPLPEDIEFKGWTLWKLPNCTDINLTVTSERFTRNSFSLITEFPGFPKFPEFFQKNILLLFSVIKLMQGQSVFCISVEKWLWTRNLGRY